MLDIKFLRENPEIVRQNIRNKFQDSKLPLVDEVIALDRENRDIKGEVEALRAQRNRLSKEIGGLMKQGKKDEAEQVKAQIAKDAERMEELDEREKVVEEEHGAVTAVPLELLNGSLVLLHHIIRALPWDQRHCLDILLLPADHLAGLYELLGKPAMGTHNNTKHRNSPFFK